MAFKPNYRRDRAERQRAARARTEEKQRKKEEKAALRKAERKAVEAPPDESKRPGSLEGYWFRETQPFLCRECRRICNRFRRQARQRSASTFPMRARPQAPRRQTFDSEPFNASTRATITQCNSLRRIDAGIRVDVAAAVT